jgi:hypothetical protein
MGVAAARVRGAPAAGTVRAGPEEELRRTVTDAYRRLLAGHDPGAVLADAQAAAVRLLALYEAAHR